MINIAINGFGRIGRLVFRALVEQGHFGSKFNVVAVGDIVPADNLAYLLKYDSIQGRFNGTVDSKKSSPDLEEDDVLVVNGREIRVVSARTPDGLPWKEMGVEMVIESTGLFVQDTVCQGHLDAGAKKVIISAPGKGDGIATFVEGVNAGDYDPAKDHLISNASCTTNCLAPVCKVLHEKFGIESGFMTTVHAYTSDQMLLDGAHSDRRRARAAGVSMIPTTTGAAKTVGLVIPELKGKLDGYAVRVPTPNVSMVDLTATLKVVASAEEVNQAMREAASNELKGILSTEDLPLVSTDFNGLRASSCVDLGLTNTIGNNLKIVAWYDNEVGFSNRVIDLAAMLGEKL